MTQGRHPNCKVSKDGIHEWQHMVCVDTHTPKNLCELCGYCLDDRTYHLIEGYPT